MLLLVKCYGNKMDQSSYNCFIFPLTQPQVTNQQKKRLSECRACINNGPIPQFLEIPL